MVSNYYDDVALETFTLFSMGHTKWSDEEVQGLDATRRANFVADCASFCLYQCELYKHTHTHTHTSACHCMCVSGVFVYLTCCIFSSSIYLLLTLSHGTRSLSLSPFCLFICFECATM